MRIHTTKLTEADIVVAAIGAGARIERLDEHGSRKRARAFDVILSGKGRRGSQYNGGTVKSATWDQWGMFLGALYRKDPLMIAGEAYVNAEHFAWSTNDRFNGEEFEHCHHQKWEWQGTAAGGRCNAQECTKCGTVKRWLITGTWAEFTASV